VANLMRRQGYSPTIPPLQILRCGVGAEDYALDMNQVLAIEGADHLSVSSADDGAIGVLSHFGAEVSVYRLGQRLQRPRRHLNPGQRYYAIVLQSRRRTWAMLVERVSRAIPLARSRVQRLPRVCGDPDTTPFSGVIDFAGIDRDDDEEAPANQQTEADLVLLMDAERLHPDVPFPMPRDDGKGPRVARPPLNLPTIAPAQQAKLQVLAFAVSSPVRTGHPLLIGLSVAQVLEIVEPMPLIQLPFSSPTVLGITQWRQRIVPAIDLAQRLRLPPLPAAQQGRWIVARANPAGDLVSFPIDPNVQVLRFPLAARPGETELPADPNDLLGVYELDAATLAIPDLSAICINQPLLLTAG
jgi:chemotaxis signal transduction protein